ncbi:hypothetical protein BH10ACI2_BH10ACI2_10040 [soil metagenome]
MKQKRAVKAKQGRLFVMKKVNDWCRLAKDRPVPGALFDEFWRESELALMFADGGLGKSLLAMQIAESICRGTSIAPLTMTAARQKVLYFDLDLTDRQLASRYSPETDCEHAIDDPYEFSDDLIRLEVDVNRPSGALTGEAFAAAIEPYVIETGARVVIIDNITLLKRASNGSRDEVPLMKELNRLKRKYGLSVLVLATTSRRHGSRPLAIADLRSSRHIANYADTVFAIGRSLIDDSVRFIKHLRSKGDEPLYDATYMPLFRQEWLGPNFLGSAFFGFGDETDQLYPACAASADDLKQTVKRLRDQGSSYGEIADQLGISKTKAYRLRMLWQPPPPERAKAVNPNYFPGVEEYDKAIEDPKFNALYEPGHPNEFTHAREYSNLTRARHEAKMEFKRSGRSMPMAEAIELVIEIEEKERDRWAEKDYSEPEPEPKLPPVPIPGVTRDVDADGNEIFVKEYRDGKPLFFYRYNSKKQLCLWERTYNGLSGCGIYKAENSQE